MPHAATPPPPARLLYTTSTTLNTPAPRRPQREATHFAMLSARPSTAALSWRCRSLLHMSSGMLSTLSCQGPWVDVCVRACVFERERAEGCQGTPAMQQLGHARAKRGVTPCQAGTPPFGDSALWGRAWTAGERACALTPRCALTYARQAGLRRRQPATHPSTHSPTPTHSTPTVPCPPKSPTHRPPPPLPHPDG